MNNQPSFLYTISYNSNYETIDTNNSYLNKLLKEIEKYYTIPNTSNGIKAKYHLNLGNIAFFLLDYPNLEFDKDIMNKKNLLNTYLSYCIKNNKYCNIKIFLSYVRDILKISKIPEQDIFAFNYYKDSDNLKNLIVTDKLELLLKNSDDIQLNKSYICNDIIDLIIVSIIEIFSQGYLIKRCKNCHKYFFNNKSNKYCPYTSPQSSKKSCYEYSVNLSYVEKRRNDPIRIQFTKISNMLRSRWYYSREEKLREELTKFSDEYNQKKADLESGKITKEEMLEFLIYSEHTYKEQFKRRYKDGSSRTNKK